MSQILHTKNYGEIEVEQSWIHDNLHIVKLANGGYAHSSGLPVQKASELKKAIPPGPELEEALFWFEHRHDEPEQVKRRLVINPDGSVVFDDGSPIQNMSDIVENLQPGPFLDAALRWFVQKQEQDRQAEQAAKTKAGRIARQMATQAKEKKQPGKGRPSSCPTISPTTPPTEMPKPSSVEVEREISV